jgi:histidine triad (HIT) family protein
MENCIFCKIIDGELPSFVVYEDDLCTSFLTIEPINDGHILVVPKQHYEFIWKCPYQEYSHLFNTSKLLAKLLQDTYKPLTVGLAIEGLSVPHTHIHLVPLYKPGELDPKLAKQATPEELQNSLDKLKKSYDENITKFREEIN